MTAVRVEPIPEEQILPRTDPAGCGTLRTERGNLPLRRLDVRADITGLAAGIEVIQGFHNPHDVPLEATYIFPLPDRAAVTRMTMTAADRVVEGELRERGAAREAYNKAIEAGQRASIAEEERPDVFTMRVGNILPGEDVTVSLTLAGPLSLVDGQAEFRFPLVVAPRYIPGAPLPGDAVGDGHAPDTDAVPDASRITPPVLLPGFPNPVALSIEVRIDPAGLPLAGVASSLHAVEESDGVLRIRPGERVNRDFILRLSYGDGADSLVLAPDREGAEGTYRLTVLPPAVDAGSPARDVVLVLDRSGSMGGWKMVAARRAAARIVDTLTDRDRFAVLTFDNVVEHPDGLPEGLVAGTDRHRYRAVEHLARVDARGGTELLAPLRQAIGLLTDESRDRVLVLVTDGPVGNEDQILRDSTAALGGIRVHTVGIDQAVNAGFLGRLAAVGGGRCELVESEDRLDDAMERIHRRIGAPLVTRLAVAGDGLELIAGSLSPARVPDLFPGVPLVLAGRYRGTAGGALVVTGQAADGSAWQARIAATVTHSAAVTALWARGHLRDLEDRYAVTAGEALEKEIVGDSLRFGVLCRFTAYLAVDNRVVTEGGTPHRVVQPVELPAGWEPQAPRAVPLAFAASMMAPPPAPGAMPAPAPMVAQAADFAGRTGVMGARRARATFRTPAPVPSGADGRQNPDRTADLRIEAQRLRDAAGESPARRRDRLDDLASRLDALARAEGSTERGDRLRALVTELRDERTDLEQRWQRALAVLDEMTGGAPAPQPRRSAFWKR